MMGWRDQSVPIDPYETAPERAGRVMGAPSPSRWREQSEPIDLPDAPIDPLRSAMQPFWGFNRQIENLLNVPAALVETIGQVPMPKFALEKGQSFEGGPAPQNRLERILNRGGTEVGASLPYAAIPFAIPAARGGTAIQQALARLGQTYKTAPLTSAGAELASAAGAGVGAGIAQEAAPGSLGAEIAGQLVGGIAAPLASWTPAGIAVRLGRVAASRASKKATIDRAQEFVAQKYAGQMKGMVPELDKTAELRAMIPGFAPSLAEATGSPSFIKTQKDLEGALAGPDLDKAVARRRANLTAVQEYAAKRAPVGDEPTVIMDEGGRKVISLLEEAEQGVGRIEALRKSIADVPRPDRRVMGETMRSAFYERRQQVANQMREARAGLGLKDADVTLEAEPLLQKVVSALEPEGYFAEPALPQSYRRLKTLLEVEEAKKPGPATIEPGFSFPYGVPGKGEPKIITFDDVADLGTRIAEDIRGVRASTAPNKHVVLRGLYLMEGMLDEAIEKIGQGGPLAENFKAYKKRYLNEYIKPFRQYASKDITATDTTGAYKVRDEDVATEFWQPGNQTAVRQYLSVFGDDPKAMGALETIVLDDFGKASVVDGVIDPVKADTWLKRNAANLGELPAETRAVLNDKTARNAALLERQGELAERAKQIEDRLFVKQLRQMNAGKEIEEVLARAYKSPRLLADMIGTLDQSGRDAIKRHAWDYIIANGPESIDKNALKTILGEQHYLDLRDVTDAFAMIKRVPEPTGTADKPGVLKSVEKAIGMGLPQLASRIFTYQTGRASRAWLTTELSQRVLRGRSIIEQERIYLKALYDPEVARGLARLIYARGDRSSFGERAALGTMKKLNTRLFTLGIENRTGEEDNQ